MMLSRAHEVWHSASDTAILCDVRHQTPLPPPPPPLAPRPSPPTY